MFRTFMSIFCVQVSQVGYSIIHCLLYWGVGRGVRGNDRRIMNQKITANSGKLINLLTPNVNYSGRTAPLTSKVAFYIFIQQIQVLNILNMV